MSLLVNTITRSKIGNADLLYIHEINQSFTG